MSSQLFGYPSWPDIYKAREKLHRVVFCVAHLCIFSVTYGPKLWLRFSPIAVKALVGLARPISTPKVFL